MRDFIVSRFYELPESADVIEAFEQFEKEQMLASMESFATEHQIEEQIVMDLFSDYVFSQTISEDAIRKQLRQYQFGLLKMTKLTKSVKAFIEETYQKYRAEGE